MKKRNKGKKALTAVGAVVAAGLTPGFIAASAAGSSIQGPNPLTTAAEVVTIDGQAYSFDELYSMQHPDSAKMDTIVLNVVLEPTNATLYGAVIPIRNNNKNQTKTEKNVIYRSVDQMPEYPGGNAALQEYVKTHIKYPAKALKNKIEGRVIVEFVVDKKGKIGEVKVIRSVDKNLDKEAVRVVKSLPEFTPGRQNGQDVSVWYTLPVVFTLPQEDNN